MSSIFYTYRHGKKENGYKYEDLDRIWFTETNGSETTKPSPQITVILKNDPITSRVSWNHGPNDHELTQRSLEDATKAYTKSLVEIEAKRRETAKLTKQLLTQKHKAPTTNKDLPPTKKIKTEAKTKK